MPSINSEIPAYLTHIENMFDQNEIATDLRASRLTPYLTSKARTALLHQPASLLSDYNAWKQDLLKEHRLSPNAYRQNYLSASKSPEDSFIQYSTKLKSMLSFICSHAK